MNEKMETNWLRNSSAFLGRNDLLLLWAKIDKQKRDVKLVRNTVWGKQG